MLLNRQKISNNFHQIEEEKMEIYLYALSEMTRVA